MGFRILPIGETFPKDIWIRIRSANLRRARQRFRHLQQDYAAGQLSLAELAHRLQSWEAHLLHADTYHLRRQIFDRWSFTSPPEPLSIKISLPSEPEWEF